MSNDYKFKIYVVISFPNLNLANTSDPIFLLQNTINFLTKNYEISVVAKFMSGLARHSASLELARRVKSIICLFKRFLINANK